MNIVEVISQLVRRSVHTIAVWLNRVTHGAVHPDAVTIGGTAMHLPIAVLIADRQLIIAGIMLFVFGLFDTLDGELARLQQRASSRGMLLDASTDRIKEVLLYTGIAYYLSATGHRLGGCVAVLACGASVTVSYVKAKGEAVLAAEHKDLAPHQLNLYYQVGLVPFGVRMLIIMIGLLVGQVQAATVLVAVLASYTVFERLIFIGRKL